MNDQKAWGRLTIQDVAKKHTHPKDEMIEKAVDEELVPILANEVGAFEDLQDQSYYTSAFGQLEIGNETTTQTDKDHTKDPALKSSIKKVRDGYWWAPQEINTSVSDPQTIKYIKNYDYYTNSILDSHDHSSWYDYRLNTSSSHTTQITLKTSPYDDKAIIRIDDRVKTPDGEGVVYSFDVWPIVCVQLDNDTDVLYEYNYEELTKL
jgi:hypothetical protein